jgi:hypothetical protein
MGNLFPNLLIYVYYFGFIFIEFAFSLGNVYQLLSSVIMIMI